MKLTYIFELFKIMFPTDYVRPSIISYRAIQNNSNTLKATLEITESDCKLFHANFKTNLI